MLSRRWLFVFAALWAASAALGAMLGVTQGLNAEYFSNAQQSGTPAFSRIDPAISTAQMTADWTGNPPDVFSVRWYGYLMVREAGQYVIGTRSDDGSVLSIDGSSVADNGGSHPAQTRTGSVYLASGPHALLVDYAQTADEYEIGLLWGSDANGLTPIPSWRLSTNRVSEGRLVTARISYLLSTLSALAILLWGLSAAASVTAAAYRSVDSKSDRLAWAGLITGTVLAALVCFAIAKLWLIVGSREGNWIYGYALEFDIRSVGVAALCCAGAAALLAIPFSVFERREWLVVSLWMGLAFVIQGALRSFTPNTLAQLFASDGSNSFYSVAMTYTLQDALGDFGRLRDLWPLHAHSNMPGKLLVVYALKLISTDPGVLAWLVIAVSNIAGGALIYLLVRDVFNDRRTALFTLVLYLFVPSRLYFFPSLNTVTPILALLALWLYLRWLRTKASVYAALFGITVYGLVFCEPVALGIGLPVVALGLRALWQRETTWGLLTRHALVTVLAFAATHIFMLTVFHFNLFDAFNLVAVTAVGFNERYNRPYSLWVGQNLLDFFLGVGVCQTVLAGIAMADGLRGDDPWSTKLTRPITIVTLALLGTLLTIDLIGVGRGEVIRLWMFLACLFQIPTAYVCAQLRSRQALMLVLAMTLLQDALGTSMIGFIMAG